LLGGLVMAIAIVPRAPAAPADAASLHAAYVINFIRYTRWPEAQARSPLVIAVLGPGEQAAVLRRLARHAGPIEGRRLEVRQLPLNTIAPARTKAIATLRSGLANADVVYVAGSHQSWNEAVIAAVKGEPVLTVGIGPEFVAAGGMFGLVEGDGRVHITSNEAVVRKAPIDVSARVLLLARPSGEPPR
jgi:hypothetical protein